MSILSDKAFKNIPTQETKKANYLFRITSRYLPFHSPLQMFSSLTATRGKASNCGGEQKVIISLETQWQFIFLLSQPAKLQKKQRGGVYFWLYGIAYWMLIQQKLPPPVLLFSNFAGWAPPQLFAVHIFTNVKKVVLVDQIFTFFLFIYLSCFVMYIILLSL